MDRKDEFGDSLKRYESIETDRILLPLLPIYARLDGKCFSKFTSGFKRPYDETLSKIMVETTKYLVEETHALIGYTQSDEISLAWDFSEPNTQTMFGGRIQKICSVLAGMCSSKFVQICLQGHNNFESEIAHKLPSFDCRVINLPNKTECANMFLWREQDATKNAISMAARAYFSHRDLQNKSGPEMQEMLFSKFDINFNDYPAFFKRGTFVRKIVEQVIISEEHQQRMPEAFRPGNTPVTRSRIIEVDMPSFRKVINRVDVIFNKAEPQILEVDILEKD